MKSIESQADDSLHAVFSPGLSSLLLASMCAFSVLLIVCLSQSNANKFYPESNSCSAPALPPGCVPLSVTCHTAYSKSGVIFTLPTLSSFI